MEIEKNKIRKLCVGIPMYNEEAGAEKCISVVTSVIEKLASSVIILVVNDGSKDRTLSILNELKKSNSFLHVYDHGVNKGYGRALLTAAEEAERLGCDYILFMDSDLTNDPKDIPSFINKLEEGYDLVKASRYMRGGRVEGVPYYRYIISRLGNLMASYLFGMDIKDCTNGFRAIKISLLTGLEFKEKKFSLIMEEMYQLKRRGVKAIEIPVTLYNRSDEQRKTAFTYTPQVFWNYLKYPVRAFMREYSEIGANRSRVIYDIITVLLSVGVTSLISIFLLRISLRIPASIGFIVSYIVMNWGLGVYSRFGGSSSIFKSLLLTTSMGIAVIVSIMLGNHAAISLLFASVLYGPALLPRIFLNLTTHASNELLSPIVAENCPVLIIGGANTLAESLVEEIKSFGKKVKIYDCPEAIETSVWLRNKKGIEVVTGSKNDIFKIAQVLNKVSAVIYIPDFLSSSADLQSDEMVLQSRLAIRSFLDTFVVFQIPRLILVSSCEVYGHNPISCSERTNILPTSLHQKLYLDAESEMLSNFRIATVTILRMDSLESGFVLAKEVAYAIRLVLGAKAKSVNREIFNVGNSLRRLERIKPLEPTISFEKIKKDLGLYLDK